LTSSIAVEKIRLNIKIKLSDSIKDALFKDSRAQRLYSRSNPGWVGESAVKKLKGRYLNSAFEANYLIVMV